MLGAAGRVAVTILIAAVWLGVVVIRCVPSPLLTLTAARGAYGVFTILLQQVMWNMFLGEVPAEAPDSAPVLVVSWVAIVVTNTIWGAVLGLVATGLGRLLLLCGSRSRAGAWVVRVRLPRGGPLGLDPAGGVGPFLSPRSEKTLLKATAPERAREQNRARASSNRIERKDYL